METKQKTALVTGGSRGLGKNAAIQIAKKGIAVIITYNARPDDAHLVVEEIKNHGGKAAALHLNTGVVADF